MTVNLRCSYEEHTVHLVNSNQTEVVMDTKGRKLFRYVAGIMTAVVLMGSAYVTTAMASGIGLIDTADLLDVHAEASDSSDVVGQVMDEGHVAILGRADGWVQIKAGEIIGWVPEANLIETEVSNEEAYEANQKVVAEFAEDVMAALEEEMETDSEGAQPEEESEAEEPAASGNEQFSEEDAEQEAALEEASAEQEDEEKELLNAEELAREQARLLAEAQKQAQEQAEAFAREQAKAVEAVQKLAAEQAKAAEEQAKAAQEAQKLAEEQERAVQEAQKLAAEQAKAVQEAQKLAEEQARAEALAQKQAQEQAKAAELAQKQEAQEAISQEALNAANVSEEDLELLASIIYCEAKGEPYIGKVAVGNVVLNRVKSSRYPDTIKGVIYAKGQFSPVKNGSMAKALKNDSADASCYQAALEALAGSAPVGEKTSFRRVNGRSGQVIGHHVFY